MVQEHPFAQYIRIIGKGPRLSRPLTRKEAFEAATMIVREEVEPLQLGAFLCILRVRQEDPEEGVGFVEAVRANLMRPTDLPCVDLDWPTYAGKVRHLPYYILAALCMAQSGIRIFMHGVEGHTPDRLYTSQVLAGLGIAPAASLEDAARKIETNQFAYVGLEQISPVLKNIIDLKSTLGLRSPVNTFARMINTFEASCVFQCITHTAYRDIHRDCADLLGQKSMCVFKGEGGEIERRPAKPVLVQYLHNGVKSEETWPKMIDAAEAGYDDVLDVEKLKQIWTGDVETVYATAAITGTIAIALRTMGRADTIETAQAMADDLWANRLKDKIPYAA